MTDKIDRASELEQIQRDHALAKHKTQKQVASRLYCEDCDELIPEIRRQKVTGCTRCIDCQEIYEQRHKHYR